MTTTTIVIGIVFVVFIVGFVLHKISRSGGGRSSASSEPTDSGATGHDYSYSSEHSTDSSSDFSADSGGDGGGGDGGGSD